MNISKTNISIYLSTFYLLALGNSPALTQEEANPKEEIKAIEIELNKIKSAYEVEINRLEQRIKDLEDRQKISEVRVTETAKKIEETKYSAPVSAGPITTNSTFNPAISLILNGKFTSFSQDPEEYAIPGFPLGGEPGPGPEGLGLGETELTLSSNVNDLFFGSTTLAVDVAHGGAELELEEAFIQTLGLPSGLTLKAGRFFASLGYLNENHAHTDNFIDRPLPYQAMLGKQFNDDGVELALTLPTDFYSEIGVALFKGGDFPAGGSINSGTGAYNAFLRIGGDIGYSNTWRLGASYLHAGSEGRITGLHEEDGHEEEGHEEEGHEEEDHEEPLPLDFDGNTNLFVADFKYVWSPNGNSTERSFSLVGEYMHRTQKGQFNGIDYDGTDSGWYLEGMYKFKRGWRLGYRYSAMNPETQIPTSLLGTDLNGLGRNPNSHSFTLDWARNDFSVLRMQYSRDLSRPIVDNRFMLQYTMSIGAHGAHNF